MSTISSEEMAQIVKKVGTPRSRNRKIPLDVEKIRAMRRAGFSKAQIAEYFGVCKMTIVRRLKGP